MFNLETAVQNFFQPVNAPMQALSGIQDAVVDTGDDVIRSMALEMLDNAADMLTAMDDNPVAASMAASLKRETQAVFEAVRNAPKGQLPRSLVQRVQSCVQSVSAACVSATTISTRARATEHSIVDEAWKETKRATDELFSSVSRVVADPVGAVMGKPIAKVDLIPAGARVTGNGTIILPNGARIIQEVDLTETAEDEARRAAPKDRQRIQAARIARREARETGTYRDRGRAARDQARLEATSRADEDRREEWMRNEDSARVALGQGNIIERADTAFEIAGRNGVQFFHELKIREYLKNLPPHLRAAFDLDRDGKVEFWEFDRVRNELVDMSYAQMAALDGNRDTYFDITRGGLVSEAHTIREAEFLRAARAMALLRTLEQAELNRLSTQHARNGTIDLNGDGEVTRNEVRRVINGLGMTVSQADFNRNGRLDAAELDAILLLAEVKEKLGTNQVSMSYDKNGDGRVSYHEAAEALRAKGITRADQIDTDAEFRAKMGAAPSAPGGVVRKDMNTEVAEAIREYTRLGYKDGLQGDANGDGRVTTAEAVAALRARGITSLDSIDGADNNLSAAELQRALNRPVVSRPAPVRPRQG